MNPLKLGTGSVSLVTFPGGGLGNRILSLGCLLSLAAELDYKPTLFWSQDKVMGWARFEDLFDTTDLPFKIVQGYRSTIMKTNYSNVPEASNQRWNLPQRIFLRMFSSLTQFSFDKIDILNSNNKRVQYMERRSSDFLTYRKILIYAWLRFRYNCDISWLKPAPHILPRIVELNEQFVPNTVGVQLRGTDWVYTPPVEKIIARMHAEVELNPQVKFFFASDSDKAKKLIIDTFGDRLIRDRSYPKGWSMRRTIQGQQGAVVDLFGLANSSRIIGAKYSSFPLAAAMMGNKPILNIEGQHH